MTYDIIDIFWRIAVLTGVIGIMVGMLALIRLLREIYKRVDDFTELAERSSQTRINR